MPADDKENARLAVSQIVLDVMGGLDMAYPKTTAKRRSELDAIRRQLSRNHEPRQGAHGKVDADD